MGDMLPRLPLVTHFLLPFGAVFGSFLLPRTLLFPDCITDVQYLMKLEVSQVGR